MVNNICFQLIPAEDVEGFPKKASIWASSVQVRSIKLYSYSTDSQQFLKGLYAERHSQKGSTKLTKICKLLLSDLNLILFSSFFKILFYFFNFKKQAVKPTAELIITLL